MKNVMILFSIVTALFAFSTLYNIDKVGKLKVKLKRSEQSELKLRDIIRTKDLIIETQAKEFEKYKFTQDFKKVMDSCKTKEDVYLKLMNLKAETEYNRILLNLK